METATRLFAEHGYEQTTVAQIASAADVATKTFFNYFPSKDEVLFASARQRSTIPLEVIAGRREGETIPDLLTRVYRTMVADYDAEGDALLGPELRRAVAHLIKTVPALQATSLRIMFEMQRDFADALLEVYPDELDPISAAAVVGALMGATRAVAWLSIELDHSEAEYWAALERAIDIALRGLPT